MQMQARGTVSMGMLHRHTLWLILGNFAIYALAFAYFQRQRNAAERGSQPNPWSVRIIAAPSFMVGGRV
jgi:hypothetical protein